MTRLLGSLMLAGMKRELSSPLQNAMQALFLCTVITIFHFVWEAALSHGPMGPAGSTVTSYTWYVLLTELVVLSPPFIHRTVQEDINSQRYLASLLRPVSYPLLVLTEGLGALCIRWIGLAVIGICFTHWLCGANPFAGTEILLPLCMTLFSAAILMMLLALIGSSAFWLHDVFPLHLMVMKLVFVLGGLLMPLFLYPDWIVPLAYFTPFATMLFGCGSTAFGIDIVRELHTAAAIAAWGAASASLFLIVFEMHARRIMRGSV